MGSVPAFSGCEVAGLYDHGVQHMRTITPQQKKKHMCGWGLVKGPGGTRVEELGSDWTAEDRDGFRSQR